MGYKICSGSVAYAALRRLGAAATIAFAVQQMQAGSLLTLQIYCVSSESKPGWRYFNTTAFPQLGFVAAAPDMSISQIKSVSTRKSLQPMTIVRSDGSQETHREAVTTVDVEFMPEDARKFRELTAKHLGERLLWLLGNEELFAPVIKIAVEGSSVSVTLRPGIDPEIVRTQLEKLREESR